MNGLEKERKKERKKEEEDGRGGVNKAFTENSRRPGNELFWQPFSLGPDPW